jgi:tetratricopeptide (TPR) repeat protein
MTPVAATTLERARQLRLRGFAHNTAGRPQQAARSLRAALQLLPPLPEAATREVDVVRVACLLTLAVCDLATVGLPAALARLEDARRIAGDDAELAARCRCQRGFLLGRGGDLARAEADLAVVLEQPHWFTPAERASTLLNRGMVHVELGRPAAAASDFESASAVAREAGDDQPLAALAFMAEHNRGFALYLSGDLPGALAAMSAAEELPADVFRGPSLFDRARVLHEAGLLDEAVEALDRARAACRPRLDQLLRAEVDLERARVLRLAGEFDEAAATARAARARYRRQGAPALVQRAELTVLDCDLSRGRRLEDVLRGALAVEAAAVDLGDAELRARSCSVAAEAAVRLGRVELAGEVLGRYPEASFGLVVRLRHDYAVALVEQASGRSPRRVLAAAAAALRASQATSATLDSRAARKVLALRLAGLDLAWALDRGPAAVLASLERWTSPGLPALRPPADGRHADLTQRLRVLSRTLLDEPPDATTPARRAEVAGLRRELTALGLTQRQDGTAAEAPANLADALAALAAAGRDLLWLFVHDGGVWGVGVTGGRRRILRLAGLAECLEVSRRVEADLRALASLAAPPLRRAITESLAAGLDWLDDALLRPWRLRGAGLVVVGCHPVAAVPWGMLPSLAGVGVTVARSVTGWAGGQRPGSAGLAGAGPDRRDARPGKPGLVAGRVAAGVSAGTGTMAELVEASAVEPVRGGWSGFAAGDAGAKPSEMAVGSIGAGPSELAVGSAPATQTGSLADSVGAQPPGSAARGDVGPDQPGTTAGAPVVRVLTGPGLQHAAAEAAAVAGAWGVRASAGLAAGAELRAALAEADLVHVAAHGVHRAASPLFSSLRLADGELFAHELPAGRVRARHVVLSACEVGAAAVRPGDEPLGLASTLLALGVGSVVAAVGPVSDERTAELMAGYHAGLAAGLTADVALARVGHDTPFIVMGSTWARDAEVAGDG